MRHLYANLAFAMAACLAAGAQAQSTAAAQDWDQCPLPDNLVSNASRTQWQPNALLQAQGWVMDSGSPNESRQPKAGKMMPETLGSWFMRATLYANATRYKIVCKYAMTYVYQPNALPAEAYLAKEHKRGGAGNRFQAEIFNHWNFAPQVYRVDAAATAACGGGEAPGNPRLCRWNWQRGHAAQTR